MKICHITSAHKPDDIRIFHKQCKTLSNHGHDVTILSIKSKDSINNTKVKFDNVSIKPGRLYRFLFSNSKLLKKALEINADIYQAHDPELLFLLIQLHKKGKKVIFDFHEDVYEQILAKTYIPRYLRFPISKMYNLYEKISMNKLDGIICATETIHNKKNYRSVRKEIIYNYPIYAEFDNNLDKKIESKKMIYIGGISEERGINKLIEIAEKRPQYELIICGAFYDEDLEKRIKIQSSSNVKYMGYLNRNEIAEILQKVNLGFVLLENNPRYKVSIPIKMFEYMAAGLPVIANDFPLWRGFIEGNKAGFNVDMNNLEDILSKVDFIMNNINEGIGMGTRGQIAVKEKYNWQNEGAKLINFYNEIGGNVK